MKRLAVVIALLAAALTGGVGRSQAAFVATSANPDTFATAAVFNAVSVTLTDPGTPLRATTGLSATATSDRPIVGVRFQTAPAGSGTWTDRCTDDIAPYACDWDTTGVADGSYDVRAIALDASGYSQNSTVGARRVDNTAPTATLTDPGSPLTGTRTVSATASDTGGGIASVAFEYRTSGSWTALCTDSNAPYSCAWDTAALPDGLYDVRATATDDAGNTAGSTVANRLLDNGAPTIAVTTDTTPKRGTITLQSTSGDGSGTGVASVTYRVRTSPAGAWSTACTTASAPFSCSFDTTTRSDGLYDLQAIATDGVSLATTSATVTGVRFDNTNPATTTMVNPGTPLSGAVPLSGAATDAGSGIASVRFQYAPTGTTTWADACTDASTPYSCSWDTSTATDGVYDLRALSTDNAGNTRASATIASRRVDNVAPAVAITDPGSPLRATTTIYATASDGGGIANVVIQRKPSSGSTWTTICTDASSPYSCAWNTTGVTDGSYDLRATATDNFGRTATSTVTGRVVDNTGPRAGAVTSASGGTAGTLGNGDTLTFTFTEAIAPASLVTGWAGASRPVSIFFDRGASTTSVAVTDTATGSTVPIGTVAFTGRFVNNGGATFNATMSVSGAALTLTLSGTATQGSVRNDAVPAAIAWTNTTTVTDIAGNAGVATAVTGSGQL
jgi:hypothetical protein